MLRIGRLAALLCLACFVATRATAGAKTDVLEFHNGDRLTCELKVLQRGMLQVKTDGLGTIDVEWIRVKWVRSSGLFEVEDLLGRIYFGSLQPSLADGKLDVVGLAGTHTLDLALVVRIEQLRRSFWKRLSGSIDVGFSHTSSSRLTQFSLEGSLRYRRPSFELQLSADSLLSSQPEVPETRRNSLEFGYLRFRGRRQVAFGQVRLEQNRELGYDLRAGLRGGWGRYLLRHPGNDVLAAFGLNVNHEIPVEGVATDNLEGLIALDWEKFSFTTPKTDLSVRLLFYPSLSQWGRYRLDLNARVKQEIFRDLFVSLKGYDSFDSEPATTGASRNDWSVSLGLGYSFH